MRFKLIPDSTAKLALKRKDSGYASRGCRKRRTRLSPEDSNAAPKEEPHNETPSRQFKYVTYRETEDGDPGEIIGVEFGTGDQRGFRPDLPVDQG